MILVLFRLYARFFRENLDSMDVGLVGLGLGLGLVLR